MVKKTTSNSPLKAIKGMHDVLPEDSELWLRVEAVCADVLAGHGYRQIRTPMLESTQLFARSIGADTDIVSKEMYTFDDRNGDSLTLRPEGTASCVRAGIEHGLFYNQQQRLWYLGPMFRHERPQKGRYRQFYQLGAECYGWSTPDIEAEIISLIAQLFERLGLQKTELQINSLGDLDTRARYRAALVAYLADYKPELDDDSVRRLGSNPLRILDSKNPAVRKVLVNAPSILDFLSADSARHFDQLQCYLRDMNIGYRVNPGLVRGLDYYNDTVFEWVNADFGAQSTVCAGGRYDGLVSQLGGAATPGFGFAMGMERLLQILQEQKVADELAAPFPLDVFIISTGSKARSQALVLQQQLTRAGRSVQLFCGEASLKNQIKRADRSQALVALIIGEAEAAQESVNIKPLRGQRGENAQQTILQNDALNAVTNLLESL